MEWECKKCISVTYCKQKLTNTSGGLPPAACNYLPNTFQETLLLLSEKLSLSYFSHNRLPVSKVSTSKHYGPTQVWARVYKYFFPLPFFRVLACTRCSCQITSTALVLILEYISKVLVLLWVHHEYIMSTWRSFKSRKWERKTIDCFSCYVRYLNKNKIINCSRIFFLFRTWIY